MKIGHYTRENFKNLRFFVKNSRWFRLMAGSLSGEKRGKFCFCRKAAEENKNNKSTCCSWIFVFSERIQYFYFRIHTAVTEKSFRESEEAQRRRSLNAIIFKYMFQFPWVFFIYFFFLNKTMQCEEILGKWCRVELLNGEI
jgi:hypothetical protein